ALTLARSPRRVFRLGYNTNGLAHHRVEDALRLLAELGYRAASITPDVGQLDLYRLDRAGGRRGRGAPRRPRPPLPGGRGGRYLVDARRKHFPTLLESAARERRRRVDFLRRSIDLAADLGAPLVSIWSGCAPSGVTGDLAGPVPGLAQRSAVRKPRVAKS